MGNGFKLIIFDLDGTLVETGAEIANSVNDTLAHYALPPVSQQQVNGWIGYGTLELLVQAMAFVTQVPLDTARAREDLAQVKEEFDRNYARHCATISTLFPEVHAVLDKLREGGTIRAMVTNKDMRFTNALLEKHDLNGRLEYVLSGDCVAAKKPDPIGILDCLKFFQLKRKHALYVGDSSIDVAAARAAGIKVWLLPYGYNMNQPIEISAPDRIITTIAALLD